MAKQQSSNRRVLGPAVLVFTIFKFVYHRKFVQYMDSAARCF